MNTKFYPLLIGILVSLLFGAACGAVAVDEPAVLEKPYVDNDPYYFSEAAATEAMAFEGYDWQQDTAAQAESAGVEALGLAGAGEPDRSTYPKENEPNDMFFEDYGVNPSIDTEYDHLSTFALDVDTGSYTIMRNYINDGYLPPQESVRVEEYVNYFEQGYASPPAHQAFSIYMDGAPSPFTESNRYHMLRVGIQGYEVSDRARKDVSLTFVIDVSGSMDLDNRLGLVKRSLELLVEGLGPNDQVGIVVYGSNARIVLDPTPASNKGRILDAIYSLRTEGATNAEAGIRLGYRQAMRAYEPGAVNRIILCSDGVANVGRTEADQILREVRGYVEEGISLATFGFGMDNYNDTLMEQLADNGNGFYAYIDDINEAKRLFVDDLTGTLQTIAMDAKVQVDFNPNVVSEYRLVGFENRDVADRDFRNNNVDAGEIGAGHSVTALYELKLYPRSFGQIATAYLRWEDPDTREVMELSKDFYPSELEREFRDADPYFQRAVIVAEYAEILRASYWAHGSDLANVYENAQWISEYLYREADMREFVDLVREARRMSYRY
ncbi:MAG: von Willebrand factor type A domain-containing protein [Anaerolineae bacterium]|nr:von Willebrand factor type A domain-containing protein [Anaerolineae bacterium]